MKRVFPWVGVALVMSLATAVQAEVPRSVPSSKMPSTLSATERSKAATEILKKPVQTGTPVSLTWYHMIDTPVYSMAALEPLVVGFDLVKQKPFARFEPEGTLFLSISKIDTQARTYFVDCVVSAKPGTQVEWWVRDSLNPAANVAEGVQGITYVSGVGHVSFVLNKPKTAKFVDLSFSPTLIDFFVYQCDVASVL